MVTLKILHNFLKVSQSIVDVEDEESRVDREFTELSEQRYTCCYIVCQHCFSRGYFLHKV